MSQGRGNRAEAHRTAAGQGPAAEDAERTSAPRRTPCAATRPRPWSPREAGRRDRHRAATVGYPHPARRSEPGDRRGRGADRAPDPEPTPQSSRSRQGSCRPPVVRQPRTSTRQLTAVNCCPIPGRITLRAAGLTVGSPPRGATCRKRSTLVGSPAPPGSACGAGSRRSSPAPEDPDKAPLLPTPRHRDRSSHPRPATHRSPPLRRAKSDRCSRLHRPALPSATAPPFPATFSVAAKMACATP